MAGEQETAADLRRLYTGQAGLWPGTGEGRCGGRQTEKFGGEKTMARQRNPLIISPNSILCFQPGQHLVLQSLQNKGGLGKL